MAAFLPLWRKIGQDCFAFLAIFKTEVNPSILACFCGIGWDWSISIKLGRRELQIVNPWEKWNKSVYIRAMEAQNARCPFPKSHHCTCGGNSSRYFAWDDAWSCSMLPAWGSTSEVSRVETFETETLKVRKVEHHQLPSASFLRYSCDTCSRLKTQNVPPCYRNTGFSPPSCFDMTDRRCLGTQLWCGQAKDSNGRQPAGHGTLQPRAREDKF